MQQLVVAGMASPEGLASSFDNGADGPEQEGGRMQPSSESAFVEVVRAARNE